MGSYRELEREVSLGDGESIEATVDPMAEVGKEAGSMGGIVYSFPLVIEGHGAFIKGGKRLKAAFIKAGAQTWQRPVRVKITAKGKPRDVERDYRVEVTKVGA